jgi:hypothetical protein
MAFEVGATLLIVGLAAGSASAASTETLPSSPLQNHAAPPGQYLLQQQGDGALLSLPSSADGAKDGEAAPEEPPANGNEPAPSPGAKPVVKPAAGATQPEGEAGEEEAESEASPSASDEPAAAGNTAGASAAPPADGAPKPADGAGAPPADGAVPPAAAAAAPVSEPPVNIMGNASIGNVTGQVGPDGVAPPAAEAPDGVSPAPVPTTSTQPVKDAAGADANKAPANALPPGQIIVPGGMSIAIGTQMSFGQSTFQVGAGYARDPMVDWSVSLAPSYMFPDGTRVSANASLSQELTLSGSDDDPHTMILSDVGLGVSRPLYSFERGPALFGSLAMQVPTSESSRVESLVTSLGARVSASQPVGPVFLSFGTGFRKNFHRYTHPVRDPRAGDELVTRDGLVVEDVVTGIGRFGGSELAGATYFDGESNNTSMVFSNSLSAFYPATEKLGLGISYNLSHSWTYESYALNDIDLDICEGVDACRSGVGASAGRGRRDSHGGTVFANYQALHQLAFGLGMATGGPTRTADDKRIRFPFFNFEGEESNMTTFFISATYTESIPL